MYLNNVQITINTKLTLGISNLIILVYKLIKVKRKKSIHSNFIQFRMKLFKLVKPTLFFSAKKKKKKKANFILTSSKQEVA